MWDARCIPVSRITYGAQQFVFVNHLGDLDVVRVDDWTRHGWVGNGEAMAAD